MLENGFYKPRSLEAGTPAAWRVHPITRCSFVMGVQELAKLILGNKDEPQGMEEK